MLMGKINSKKKGSAGELEIVHILKDFGFESARRGQQFSGLNGDEDVVCDELKELHLEIKRVEKLQLEKAMEQSIKDSEIKGKIPTVFHRKNRSFWICSMRLGDFLTLYSELLWLRKKFKELS